MTRQAGTILFGVSIVALASSYGTPFALAQSADRADGEVQEIIVTAQRREQNILDVPISVSTFSDDDIEDRNIRGSREYVQLAPNVFFSGNDAQGTRNGDITIRGISDLTSGANERIIQTRPSVGFYVDDFSVASVASGSANPPLDDIERIEILRGPQTTYFGRSATGGAINVVTKKPNDETMAKVRAGYGSYDTYQFGAIGNVPLADNLFIRGGVSYEETDGAIENRHPDGNDADGEFLNSRIAVRWQPANWTFDLTGQIIRTDEGNLGRIPTGVDIGGPATFTTGGTAGEASCGRDSAIYFPNNNGFNCENADTFTKTDNDLVTLKAFYDAGAMTFTSITGYIETRFDQLEDLDNAGTDGFNRRNDYTSESFSQEVRVASADPFDLAGLSVGWTLGGYYYDDDFQANNTIISGADVVPVLVGFLTVPGDFPNENNQFVERDGWAVFADFEIGLTEALTLTAGVRYSEDNDEQFWTNTYTSFACAPRQVVGGVVPPLAAGCDLRPDQTAPLPVFSDGTGNFYVTGGRFDQIAGNPFTAAENSSTDLSPRLALTWRPNESHSIYATYSTGYRPAGARVAPDSTGVGSLGDTRSLYDEEDVANYEIGWKGSFADGRLYGELSLFRIDWKDMQVRLSRTVCEPTPGELVEVSDPRCAGLPFFPDNRVSNADSARSQGVEFLLLGRPTDGLTLSGSVGYLDAEFRDFTDSTIGDVSGRRMPFSPKWSLTGSAQYEWTMGANLDAIFRADVMHRTTTFLRFGDLNNPGFPYETGSNTMVNLGAGLDWKNHSLNISVHNVFEEDIPGGIDGFSGLGTVALPSPRTWLLSWTAKFGG